ncbi:MAG: family 10 glycosylhydrolase [Planctomycetota bacterium]|nr:family 10 glycosylhydrolase [Planctomycetota bacterium]
MKPHLLLSSLALTLVILVAGCSRQVEVPIEKALWITRWDYLTQEQVRTCITNAAEGGFDTVLFQVRGNGTVFYRSALEPWAEEYDHQDPGFDPLAVACQEAERVGISIHAWINAVPGWRGEQEPPATSPPHHWHARPEWFLYDSDGARQPLQPDYYVALNPCLPEVRHHVSNICAELVENYPIDGIHLDYIRFLESGVHTDYPRDATSLQLFREQSGCDTPESNPEAWEKWRRDQVTELVKEIRIAVRKADREALLTAAVYRTPQIAYHRVRQDWPRWLRLGLIDAVFPMQYDREIDRFEQRVAECLREASGYPVLMGIGTYLHEDPRVTRRQAQLARRLGCQGVSHFAYSSFWPAGAAGSSDDQIRQARRDQLLPIQ